jgi:hypothetical protein
MEVVGSHETESSLALSATLSPCRENVSGSKQSLMKALGKIEAEMRHKPDTI